MNDPVIPRIRVLRLMVGGFFLAAALLLCVFVLSPPRMVLLVKAGDAGHELAAIVLADGSRVQVGYEHSMYGVRQSEVFSIGPGPVFRLEKVEFGSLAAAVYYDPDPSSGLLVEEGAWVIPGAGKSYPVLKYRAGPGTGHALKVMEQTIDLSRRSAGWDGPIQLELERRSGVRSIFTALRSGIFDGYGR